MKYCLNPKLPIQCSHNWGRCCNGLLPASKLALVFLLLIGAFSPARPDLFSKNEMLGINSRDFNSAELICRGKFILHGPQSTYYTIETHRESNKVSFLAKFEPEMIIRGEAPPSETISVVVPVDDSQFPVTAKFPWHRKIVLLLNKERDGKRHFLVNPGNSWLLLPDASGVSPYPSHDPMTSFQNQVRIALSEPATLDFTVDEEKNMARYLDIMAHSIANDASSLGRPVKAEQVFAALTGPAYVAHSLKQVRQLVVKQAIETVEKCGINDLQTISSLSRLSDFPDEDTRLRALAARLNVSRGKEQLEALTETLRLLNLGVHSDRVVRRLEGMLGRASKGLGESGNIDCVRLLLANRDPAVRSAGVSALRHLTPSEASLPLLDLALSDRDQAVQYLVISTMYDIARELGYRKRRQKPDLPPSSVFKENPDLWVDQWSSWWKANSDVLSSRTREIQ